MLTFAGSDPLAPLMRVMEVTRPGVNGVALQQVGKRSAPVTITTEADVDTLSTWIASAKALVGTIVTVTAPDARSIPYVFVHDVQIDWNATRKALKASGGLTSGLWFVRAVWVLQNVSAA